MHNRDTVASHPPDTVPQTDFTKAMASYGLAALDVGWRLSRQAQSPS